jgi:hypothetical protein
MDQKPRVGRTQTEERSKRGGRRSTESIDASGPRVGGNLSQHARLAFRSCLNHVRDLDFLRSGIFGVRNRLPASSTVPVRKRLKSPSKSRLKSNSSSKTSLLRTIFAMSILRY